MKITEITTFRCFLEIYQNSQKRTKLSEPAAYVFIAEKCGHFDTVTERSKLSKLEVFRAGILRKQPFLVDFYWFLTVLKLWCLVGLH